MNEIKGFFQRLKDGFVRLMPSGHGEHSADTLFPHMQERHIVHGGGGSRQMYAGGQGQQQPPTSVQCYQAVGVLRRARIVDQQAAFDYNELIGLMDS